MLIYYVWLHYIILSYIVNLFPNSVSLGSSAIVKVPEQVGAAKSAGNRVPGKVPGRSFLLRENPSGQPDRHGARLGTGFPARGSQARFPGTGSQGFPARGSQARFPGTGSQARFPSRVHRKRFPASFPSKVPRQGYQQGSQARFPGTGSQARVPSKRFPSKVPRQGSQARFPSKVPRQGNQEEVPSKVPK